MRCTNALSASKLNWIQAHAKSVEALSAKTVYRTAKTAHNAEDWRARSNQMQYWKSLLHKASNHASIVEKCLSSQITRATTINVKKLQKRQRKLHNRIQLHKRKKNLLHQSNKDKLLHQFNKDKLLHPLSKDKLLYPLSKDKLLHPLNKDNLLQQLSKDKHLNASKDKQPQQSNKDSLHSLNRDKPLQTLFKDKQLAPMPLLHNDKLELIDSKGHE